MNGAKPATRDVVLWAIRQLSGRSRRLVAEAHRRWVRFCALWRRSLQLRVVVSTLALSSAVVFVLGMVLQSQITDRLLAAKSAAAVQQAEASKLVIERELIGARTDSDVLANQMNIALNRLTSPNSDGSDPASSGAGAFDPVLIDAQSAPGQGGPPITAGQYAADVPGDLSHLVQNGNLAEEIHTVTRKDTGSVTLLVVGVPVRSTNHILQLYLLYPLTAEQRTISVVQSTLIVGGLVLLLLLAGITNLVTRQVVRPVRQAAEVAERFADGNLSERLPVIGEDDVARLGSAYNKMAANIQAQIEQLEAFGQLQRRFTSDVSHELRTPLTTVRMAADVLHASRAQFPEGLSRSTELLVNELDRFEALLTDLLEISRLDAGVAELAVELVDVRAVASTAVDSVRAIAADVGVPIELHLPPQEVAADIDSRRVERILRNLLANAIDHGDGKPVGLYVGADAHAVAVAVRDHGIGLRSGEEELVFNRFWRADPSRNRRTGGTGLGLSISLEDARLHGGWLDAWGRPHEGACFRLTLPRKRDVVLAASPLPLPPPEPPATESGSSHPGQPSRPGGRPDGDGRRPAADRAAEPSGVAGLHWAPASATSGSAVTAPASSRTTTPTTSGEV